jgi:hypothetical protein
MFKYRANTKILLLYERICFGHLSRLNELCINHEVDRRLTCSWGGGGGGGGGWCFYFIRKNKKIIKI